MFTCLQRRLSRAFFAVFDAMVGDDHWEVRPLPRNFALSPSRSITPRPRVRFSPRTNMDSSAPENEDQRVEPSTLESQAASSSRPFWDVGPFHPYEGILFMIICYVIFVIVRESADALTTQHIHYDAIFGGPCERNVSMSCPRTSRSECAGSSLCECFR